LNHDLEKVDEQGLKVDKRGLKVDEPICTAFYYCLYGYGRAGSPTLFAYHDLQSTIAVYVGKMLQELLFRRLNESWIYCLIRLWDDKK